MIQSKYSYEGMFILEHSFELPVDHSQPDSNLISLFIREIRADPKKKKPYLVFLQGGPGFESPRPVTHSGWIKYTLNHYNILLLDQRGTGRSTPVNFQTMGGRFSYQDFFR